MSYVSGPTLEILKAQLDEAKAEGYIPYAPTLGQFVTEQEATTRYANLAEWHRTRGHFWIGSGVFYLERAFPVEGMVVMSRNPDYPDSADKWERFAAAALAEVEVDGPARVSIGAEATYDVFVTFEGEPYPVADIDEVRFLVFDAAGELVHVGEAKAVADGHWQAVVGADVSGKLAAGSNRLEVVVISKRVALPSFDSTLFVTAP
jgi:peptide/nickel transport system substrate-binding protein